MTQESQASQLTSEDFSQRIPVSKRRRIQLASARDILLTYRDGATPVLLAINLGRPEERLLFRTLATLDVDEVDMLTVVMVGASTSRQLTHGRGVSIYTPRGYAKHLDARTTDDTQKETRS